jgi:hypothetical protein
MKTKPGSRKGPRRPPRGNAQPLDAIFDANPATKSAGGPVTRGESTLGRVLGQVLAFFEVRTVTAREIDLVRPTDENGWLRPQIEAKLARLNPDCPDHRELRRLATLSLDLLTAVSEKRFDPGTGWGELEPRLLRALAYLVREGDAIPDHLPGGFDDDMREFQALAMRADTVFTVFQGLQLAAAREKARASGDVNPFDRH